jgi:siroheme synthase-like protein
MAAVLYPLFLDLRGRTVVVVGAGPVGAHKALELLRAGAAVTVVAPAAVAEIAGLAAAGRLRWLRRPFAPADLDGAFLVVAATADPAVNGAVAEAAEARCRFVNSVDDPAHATAYAGSVVRRGPVTVALSTSGRAPAVSKLLRQLLDAVLPEEAVLERWVERAEALRRGWRAGGVPMERRFAALLRDLLSAEEVRP